MTEGEGRGLDHKVIDAELELTVGLLVELLTNPGDQRDADKRSAKVSKKEINERKECEKGE